MWQLATSDPIGRRVEDWDGFLQWPLPNVWLGVSVGNRQFVSRADLLRQTPAAVRFISAEPLLGPLLYDGEEGTGAHYATAGMPADASIVGSTEIMQPAWADGREGPELDLTGIDWLIVGGESGPGHRPMNAEWARDLHYVTRCDVCEDGIYRPSRPDGKGGRENVPQPCLSCDGTGTGDTAFFMKQMGGARPGDALDSLPEDLRVREFPTGKRVTMSAVTRSTS